MRRGRGAAPPRRAALAILSLFAALALLHCSDPVARSTSRAGALPAPLHEVADGRYLMGTILDITLLGEDPAALREHVEWAFARVVEIEAVASRHRPESELSRFNATAGEPPQAGYSPHMYALLGRSVEAGRTTGGAFDVTVGPLIELWWGAVKREAWPSAAELTEARALVGYDGIVIDEAASLGLTRAGSAVDFGGIGKGYALDVVKAGLAERGVTRGLLDFGGSSVWALGQAPGGGPWRLEVDAREPGGAVRILELVDRALSVSSSLGESSEIRGRRVGHVIDPRTGLTVDAARTAVSVGGSATDAEVWSTALLVLDAREGVDRASSAPGVDVWIRLENGEVAATDGFAGLWAPSSASAPGR